MSIRRTEQELQEILAVLRALPHETEWVEFKLNNTEPAEIGEYISALANAAAFGGWPCGWLVWGVKDKTHQLLGTKFNPAEARSGNEELGGWLVRLLTPRVNFQFYSIVANGKPVVLLEISAATGQPVQFKGIEYIRIGSYKKNLKDFPEKERELWRGFDRALCEQRVAAERKERELRQGFDRTPFEQHVAAERVAGSRVLQLLDYPAFFDVLSQPLPEGGKGILEALAAEGVITPDLGERWNITNLGAVLFAKRLSDFGALGRKVVRLVLYQDESRVETVREHESAKGYAAGFAELMGVLGNVLPSNEVIGQALRSRVPMFPELAIRELVANALIH